MEREHVGNSVRYYFTISFIFLFAFLESYPSDPMVLSSWRNFPLEGDNPSMKKRHSDSSIRKGKGAGRVSSPSLSPSLERPLSRSSEMTRYNKFVSVLEK